MSDLKTPNDYRLFNFDFVDANFDDLYRCQVVLKMFLEINVIEKFSLSYEVRAKFHYTDTDTGPTRTRTRTFLRRNGPARTQRSFAAKKSVSVSVSV